MPKSGRRGKRVPFVRTCGAVAQRTIREAKACWCRGTFCGRGGVLRSKEWRRDVGTDAALVSRSEADLMLRQPSLFTGTAIADKWRARFDGTVTDETVST